MHPVQVTLLTQISVELPFVLFSVFVLICVLKKIRQKKQDFVSDFFIFYAVQGIVDLSEYAMVRTAKGA